MAMKPLWLTVILRPSLTDYDISDRLYFEPLTLEDVLAVIDIEKPEGIIVHYGGQTPLKLAAALEKNGAKIIGTSQILLI